MRILAAIVLFAGAGSLQAASVTVDFDGGVSASPYLVLSQGFEFTSQNFVLDIPSNIIYFSQQPQPGVSGNAIAYCPADCTLTMTRTDGTLFGLSSAVAYAAAAGAAVSPYSVTGFYADGSSVMLNTSVTGSATSLSFGSEWNELASVVFGASTYVGVGSVVDNIVTSVVPIPAAVWLFGSALGLLGWRRRPTS